jgi:hypothetical protein
LDVLMRNLFLGCAALTAICAAPLDDGAKGAVEANAPLHVSLASYRASDGSPPLVALAAGSPQLTVVFTNNTKGHSG